MNTNRLLMLLLLAFSLNVFAKVSPFVAYETDNLKIKLSHQVRETYYSHRAGWLPLFSNGNKIVAVGK